MTLMNELVGKIGARIGGWMSRLLSSGVRLLLVKHVLSSIPIHMLSILQAPKSILVSLNRLLSNFLWG